MFETSPLAPHAAHRLSLARRSPEALLVGGFAGLVCLGTALLALPWAHAPGAVSLLDALFTATSAVCVTGLVVVDTGTAFTLPGQLVILGLIQVGGLGVMTFAAVAFQLLGRRLSLRSQAALHEALFQRNVSAQFKEAFRSILRLTLLIEAAGAVALFCGLALRQEPIHALYSAVFHAVSAFCNAGFSLYADSLTGLRDSPVILLATMALIVLGGLGHPVLLELWGRLCRARRENASPRRAPLSLHTRVVLAASGLLLALGAVGLLLFGLTGSEQSVPARATAAVFQSVTARTAGFNTVDVGALPLASVLLLVMLMFIGGSPGSCAGGIKTTSLALWLARLRARMHNHQGALLLDRYIPSDVVRRASLLVALAMLWNLVGLVVLAATEPGADLRDLLFEQVSAFATVGLSTGMTPRLSTAGRLWVVASMFVGRLGPLTIALWVFQGQQPRVRYPEGRLMIG